MSASFSAGIPLIRSICSGTRIPVGDGIGEEQLSPQWFGKLSLHLREAVPLATQSPEMRHPCPPRLIPAGARWKQSYDHV